MQPAKSKPDHERRRDYLRRHTSLLSERNSWDSHWTELADYIRPKKGRFQVSDRNQGAKKGAQTIINGTATRALRILSSGMMAGVTSPARPWFRLTMPDPELAEIGPVRMWLHRVEEVVREVLARSNVYNCLHQVYSDMAQFGTTVMMVEEDDDDVIRAYVLPVGQYALGTGASGRVDTLYRHFSMTVGQMVEKFGLEACSPLVREAYGRGTVDQWFEVLHVVEANRGHMPGRMGPEGKRFHSCWMEKSGSDECGFLRQSGFDEFPAMAPRWEVSAEDVYGTHCPGMEALGDTKALQLLEKRKAKAADKIVDPPMRAPLSMQNARASLLPGDITYHDAPGAHAVFAPAMEIHPSAIGIFGDAIEKHEHRINGAFYADLWLMMADNSKSVTATEVNERHEEKMLQLGPVMERLQDELLDPLVDRIFGILLRNGLLPEAPEEIQGEELRVEYLSIMAQAQKMLGTAGVERLASFAGNLAAVNPEVLDKVDFDQVMDEYGSMLGVPPDLLRSDEAVAEIREGRAQKQQQMETAQAAMGAAEGAKTLSQADTGGDNALTRIVNSLGGAAGAAAKPQ
jgi:hypothetical protein